MGLRLRLRVLRLAVLRLAVLPLRALATDVTFGVSRSTRRLILAVALLTLGARASAADHTYIVTTTSDGVDDNPGNGVCHTTEGTCTLRAAVMESNHTSATDTVEILVPANANAYVLSIPAAGMDDETTGNLNIDHAVTIIGGGAQRTIIDGNATDSVFTAGTDSSFGGATGITFSDLTIRNGSTASGSGGGIFVSFHVGGALHITRCVITGNSAAIGGGVSTEVATIIDRSTVSGNTAKTGGGGGVFSDEDLTIADSTVSGNSAKTGGGGVFFAGTTTDLVFYSTIAGNHAGSIGASGGGGGIYGGSAAVQVVGSVLFGNTDEIPTLPSPTLEDCDCSGTFSGSPNLVGTKTNCTITAAVANPLLGPLQLNGGQVPTRALLAASPAIGAGNPTSCAYVTPTDGRGAHRPEGDGCDLGAYEYAANGDVNGDGTRDVLDILYLINFLFAGGAAPNGLGDVNGDTLTNVADVFSLINFLFAGGPAPL